MHLDSIASPLHKEAVPNSNVSLFDAAIPGSLPVLNHDCVRSAVAAAVSLDCTVNLISRFDRKHYFYRDLPAGYQITQKFLPIAVDGRIDLDDIDGVKDPISVRISQIQLEQDSARSVLDDNGAPLEVDLNRAGMALIEIVTEPDMRSAAHAIALIQRVQSTLLYLGVARKDSTDGNMRVDVNISLQNADGSLGPRCELKNMMSLALIRRAIEAEVHRQALLKAANQPVVSSTRFYDLEADRTIESRAKDTDYDYRYMPDSDLKDLHIDENLVRSIKSSMPELPHTTRRRLVDMGLSVSQARQLVENTAAMKLFTESTSAVYKGSLTGQREPRKVADIILNTLFGVLSEQEVPLESIKLPHAAIASIYDALQRAEIASHQVKPILEKWTASDIPEDWTVYNEMDSTSDSAIVGFKSDDTLDRELRNLIGGNQKALDDLLGKSGTRKPMVFTFFAGQLMRAVKGKADEESMWRSLEQVLVKERDVEASLFQEWKESQRKRKNEKKKKSKSK